MKRIVRHVLLVLLLLVVAFTAGCTVSDKEFVVGLAMQWLAEHAIDVGRYAFTGSSGDAEVDAVLDIRSVIDGINAADKLADQGRANNDPTKLGEAIKMRPGDWTYQTSLATMMLQAGQVDTYFDWKGHAQSTWQGQGGRQQQMYLGQQIDELTHIKDVNSTTGEWASKQQKTVVYAELSRAYHEMWEVSGDPNDKALSEAYATFIE